jgi:hypothetical protein
MCVDFLRLKVGRLRNLVEFGDAARRLQQSSPCRVVWTMVRTPIIVIALIIASISCGSGVQAEKG